LWQPQNPAILFFVLNILYELARRFAALLPRIFSRAKALNNMKKDVHPKVHMDTKVTCVCGNTFTTISTLPAIQVDICGACHPLYTGTQKLIDTEGRIDKFHKKAKKTEVKKEQQEIIRKAKKDKVKPVEIKKQTSLKEMLKQIKEEEKTAEETQTPDKQTNE